MDIAVINTGGTISCVGDPLAPMSASAFAAACASIVNPIVAAPYPDLTLTYIIDLTFPESSTGTLDSTNIQPSDWCIMAAYILRHYDEYDGWVILHGTDSMDFTGGALPFLLSSFDGNGIGTALLSKPVVITGSQVPMFHQAANGPTILNFNTDAYQNFCGAVAAAQSGIPEVCVYFDSKLYRGARVVKTNANEFDAFSSPNCPALGRYGITFELEPEMILPPPVSLDVSLDNPAVRAGAAARIAAVAAAINQAPVMQLNAFPAWYDTAAGTALLANLIRACVEQGITGLILESYGEGNFPSGNPDNPQNGAIYQALHAADQSGVIIVDNTQVLQATVNDSAYAAGAWLPAVGALNPVDMTPMASFTKLIVLLATAAHQGWTAADVKNLVGLSLVGEMRDVSRLDSRRNSTLLAGQSMTTADGSATLLNDPVLGPVLTGTGGSKLWAALANPPAGQMPGRLIMQNDGNLVFYGRDNAPLWATDTGDPNGASSMLALRGSAARSTLSLEVYNYSAGVLSATLFSQNPSFRRLGTDADGSSRSASMSRQFKFSGMIAPQDPLHQITEAPAGAPAPDEHEIAPTTVPVTITNPGPARVIGIPQYAPTVIGAGAGYDPAGDCGGSFMSSQFQPNNNCYAYGCDIASNTFPQPGRASGNLITASTLNGPSVQGFAEQDGLTAVGTEIDDIRNFAAARAARNAAGGHYVALMISPAGDSNWPGDYHWARCDDNENYASWSQKDGGDQVTNFDFAGQPITNPATANWTVNQGPINPGTDNDDLIVEYQFFCYMFVPSGSVNII